MAASILYLLLMASATCDLWPFKVQTRPPFSGCLVGSAHVTYLLMGIWACAVCMLLCLFGSVCVLRAFSSLGSGLQAAWVRLLLWKGPKLKQGSGKLLCYPCKVFP